MSKTFVNVNDCKKEDKFNTARIDKVISMLNDRAKNTNITPDTRISINTYSNSAPWLDDDEVIQCMKLARESGWEFNVDPWYDNFTNSLTYSLTKYNK